MNLLKTSVLSFIATAVRMLSALVINKAIALYIGPAGLALIGQFQSFVQATSVAAQGGLNNGIVKYVSEYQARQVSVKSLLGTAVLISLATCTIVSVSIFAFSEQLSRSVLGEEKYRFAFQLFALMLPFFVANNFLLSLLNGYKEIKEWVLVNIYQSLYSLVFTSALIFFWGLNGAFIGIATSQSIIFFVALYRLNVTTSLNVQSFAVGFDTQESLRLSKFSMMALTTAATVPVSHFVIRSYIGESLGWQQAGLWQGVWYISTIYLSVITTALSVYFLPRFSELQSKHEITTEIRKGLCMLLPIAAVLAAGIFILRDLIITLLFTDQFRAMRDLFLWQLVGDVIKVAAWLIGYVTVARAMTSVFITLEVFGSLSFLLFSILFVDAFGLQGMSYAYALNYALYLLMLLFVYRKFV